jgi:hypothetical protein
MSLRNYDNANSPRLITVINDGATLTTEAPAGDRIVLLGFSNNPNLPVQELTPAVVGGLDNSALLNLTYNIDVTGKAYPSELSIAMEELLNSGASNIQIVNLGEDDRMRDMIARQTRERYIALENAYDLLVDLPIDRLYPVNVVAGLKGDGAYNDQSLIAVPSTITVGKTWEVIYDVDEWAIAAGTHKALSSVKGYVIVEDESYEKDQTAGGEDLVYQLAAICYKITSNGTFCSGAVRTINPLEFKYLTKIDLTAAGTGTYYNGSGSDLIAPNVWAIAKGYELPAVGGDDFGLIAKDADVVLAEIEAMSSMTDGAGGLKAIFKESAAQSFAGTSSTALEEVTWQTYYGVPSTSQMQKWLRFLNSFGATVVTALQEGGSSIVSYIELDPVTSANGETPDNFLMFATENSEKPSSFSDTSIILDDNGRSVDIGYLIDRVAANSIFVAGFPGTTISPKGFTFASGIGQIFGWYTNLPSNTATTRQTTLVVGSLGTLSSKAASDLTRNGYQMFINQDSSYVFNRDITSGLFINDTARTDFINRMTGNITKQALDVARDEGRKLIGTLDNARAREGLKQKLEQEYSRWANPEDGRLRRPAGVEVFSNGTASVVGRITIVLTLAIANEILEIRTVASLEA